MNTLATLLEAFRAGRRAALARAMYRRREGVSVDGVLATDPVALSYLLHVTGPVRVPQGRPLSAGNAVSMLLSEAYALLIPEPSSQMDLRVTAVLAYLHATRAVAV